MSGSPSYGQSGPAQGTPEWQTQMLADGKNPLQHQFVTQQQIDEFNKQYAAEQVKAKSDKERQTTIDLLANNPGRDSTLVAGPTKGLL